MERPIDILENTLKKSNRVSIEADILAAAISVLLRYKLPSRYRTLWSDINAVKEWIERKEEEA